MARAQIGLTVVLLLAIIGITVGLMFFRSSMAQSTVSTATNIILVLTTLLTLSWNFFFARQRPNTLPDPNSPGANNNATLSTGGTISVVHDQPVRPGAQ